MEEMFDEADVRADTIKLIHEADAADAIDEDLAYRMGKNYFELRTMAAIKFKTMVEQGNCLIPLAQPFLEKECNQSLTQKLMSQIKQDYESLVDWLVTMYLLRGMETRGRVDNPFTLEIGEQPNG